MDDRRIRGAGFGGGQRRQISTRRRKVAKAQRERQAREGEAPGEPGSRKPRIEHRWETSASEPLRVSSVAAAGGPRTDPYSHGLLFRNTRGRMRWREAQALGVMSLAKINSRSPHVAHWPGLGNGSPKNTIPAATISERTPAKAMHPTKMDCTVVLSGNSTKVTPAFGFGAMSAVLQR